MKINEVIIYVEGKSDILAMDALLYPCLLKYSKKVLESDSLKHPEGIGKNLY